MKTNHTEGPWTTGGEIGSKAGWSEFDLSRSCGGGAFATLRFYFSSNAQENAWLIAAAPELLAACDEALEYVVECIKSGQLGTTGIPAPFAIESQLRAAISKARGLT